jgi:CBS-domain-containing membrane protein
LSPYGLRDGLIRFRAAWKPYVVQSFAAGLSTFIIMFLLSIEHAVVIAALGASTFIVFARPFDLTARSRNLVGGHLIGFAVGSLCGLVPCEALVGELLLYSLAVGVSVFLMVLTYTQHPPAAATALGMAMRGPSEQALAAVLTITLLLALFHFLLRPHLRNLF